MEKPTLLIADGNEDFRLALANSLMPHFRVLHACDGLQALSLLRQEQPDTLVMDPTLPELDGLTVLETAAQEKICPMVLIVTRYIPEHLLSTAEKLGVGYIMKKPCNIPATVSRIRNLSRRLNPYQPEMWARICRLLLALGFSSKHDGFKYLIDAVMLMTEDFGQPVTKIIYPTVARRHGCSGENVERSIRSALSHAWKYRDEALWKTLFPVSWEQRPSNADFINLLAVYLQLNSEESIF